MSLFEKIVNVETGETELKPYTKEQLVEAEAAQKKLEQEIADKEAKALAKLELLNKLGITEDEAKLLLA